MILWVSDCKEFMALSVFSPLNNRQHARHSSHSLRSLMDPRVFENSFRALRPAFLKISRKTSFSERTRGQGGEGKAIERVIDLHKKQIMNRLKYKNKYLQQHSCGTFWKSSRLKAFITRRGVLSVDSYESFGYWAVEKKLLWTQRERLMIFTKRKNNNFADRLQTQQLQSNVNWRLFGRKRFSVRFRRIFSSFFFAGKKIKVFKFKV